MRHPGSPPGRAWFVTIEGPDGGGKTTQAARLAEHLRTRVTRVHLTREPGGTWLGERVRDVLMARTGSSAPTDPLTDAFLFNAARRQHVREVIRPLLDTGTTVVCARYADSSLAYQGYGSGVPLDTLRTLAAIATDGLAPDLTIVLDLPVEVGIGRKDPDEVSRWEAEFDLAFHVRVREGFLALAAAEPGRFVVVDATGDIETVAAAVARAADRRLASSEPEAPRVRNHT
ncbi:MAG: dTMP kinase [Candidatus Limnocylindrales bacterium]